MKKYLNTWDKHKNLTAKKKEERAFLEQAKLGNELAIRKLRKDHKTIFRQEAC